MGNKGKSLWIVEKTSSGAALETIWAIYNCYPKNYFNRSIAVLDKSVLGYTMPISQLSTICALFLFSLLKASALIRKALCN